METNFERVLITWRHGRRRLTDNEIVTAIHEAYLVLVTRDTVYREEAHFVNTLRAVAEGCARIRPDTVLRFVDDYPDTNARLEEIHEDDLQDRPIPRRRTFECPNVHRALPPGFSKPIEQGSDAAWTPGHSLGAATRATLTIRDQDRDASYAKARIQSGWVAQCPGILRFSAQRKHGVACPVCGVGIPPGADVGLDQVSIDKRPSGAPSRLVTGYSEPATPIYFTMHADDEDDSARYRTNRRGADLLRIYGEGPADLDDDARQLQIADRGITYALRLLQQVEQNIAQLPQGEPTPRRVYGADHAARRAHRARVRAEAEAWAFWDFGNPEWVSPPPAVVDTWCPNSAVRILSEQLHAERRVALQAFGVAERILKRLRQNHDKSQLNQGVSSSPP